MKTLLAAGFLPVMLATAHLAMGQAFVNLNFEAATVVPTMPTYGWLDWNLAVPGWGHSNGESTSIVYWGSEHLGLSQYYLLMDATSPVYAPNTHLAGEYSLAFASGIESSWDTNSPWINAFISQTGSIPPGTRSLRLLATGAFQVFVGGANVPMVSLGGISYGGDITSFAGMAAEVRIVNTANTVHTPTVVDNIQFSPVPVPEPSVIVILALGVMLMLFARSKNQSRPASG